MELDAEKIFKNKGLDYRKIKLSDKAITVSDVVKFSNGEVKLEEICKTIILQGVKSKKTYGIFLVGTSKIDFKKARDIFGEEVKIASADIVREVAGVEPGAVCPVLLKTDLYVDQNILAKDKINCGSGDHLSGIEFNPKDLDKVVNYKVVDINKG